MGDILAVEIDLARIGRHQAEGVLQHHRLARAGPAEHDQRLARRDIQVHAAQDMVAAEGFLDPAKLKDGKGHRPMLSNRVDMT